MSGFEALGAAGSIFQFIGYGIKISNKAIAVYQGKDELQELQQMALQFQEANQTFISNLKLRSSGPDSGEALLLKTATDSQKTATELLQLVNDLVLKSGEKSRRTAFKLAIKGEFHKSDVQGKKILLQSLQKQCQSQLIMLMSDRHYALADSLACVERNQAGFDPALSRTFTNLKNEIITAIQGLKPTDGVLVSQKLLDAHKLATTELPRERILSSLRYSEMGIRRSRIDDPGHSTFEWIFDSHSATSNENSAFPLMPPPIKFVPWLEKGNGVFWITGKAGSGKSTLMKHICEHPQTIEALKCWANGRELFTASHFFWYLGSPMEKSFQGLLTSILHQVLRVCPYLIASVCVDRWKEEMTGRDFTLPWTVAELLSCLDKLFAEDLEFESRPICFCFFIDGLDEYEGDYKVVDRLVRIVRNDRIKICASSRPWNKFEVAFTDSKRHGDYLELHQHTRSDIAQVATNELKYTLSRLDRAEDDWKSLVTEIVDRSEGVFLWVTLVMRKELRPMLEARESLDAVRQQLDVIPSDLNDYFERIFQRIWADTKQRQDTARIFKSCIAAHESLRINMMGVLIDPSLELLDLSKCKYTEYTHPVLWEEHKARAAQLNSRCQDLLSVSTGIDTIPQFEVGRLELPSYVLDDYSRIVFLHKSVSDFLDESPAISQELAQYAGPDFDVCFTLPMAYIFLVHKAAKVWKWSLSTPQNSNSNSRRLVVDWSNNSLVYLCQSSSKLTAKKLIHELDTAMQLMNADSDLHWSVQLSREYFSCIISEDCAHDRDLLAHLIGVGLTSYVDAATEEDPHILRRDGKLPCLAYVLGLDIVMVDPTEYFQTPGSDRSRQLQMARLLLERGCDPNEKVHKCTLFDLYLRKLLEQTPCDELARQMVWLLIEHGAKSVRDRTEETKRTEERHGRTAKYHKKRVWHEEITEYETNSMKATLINCFGEDEAKEMCERIAQNDPVQGWGTWLVTRASSFVWG